VFIWLHAATADNFQMQALRRLQKGIWSGHFNLVHLSPHKVVEKLVAQRAGYGTVLGRVCKLAGTQRNGTHATPSVAHDAWRRAITRATTLAFGHGCGLAPPPFYR
jgi:hypothetical protein